MTIESFITGHEPAIRLGALLGIPGVIARGYTSDFGFNVPWWDRLMGTCRAQPEFGHDGMTIGHPAYRDRWRLTLPRLMLLPFRRQPVADDPAARSAP